MIFSTSALSVGKSSVAVSQTLQVAFGFDDSIQDMMAKEGKLTIDAFAVKLRDR
jgi:hypothetical protein